MKLIALASLLGSSLLFTACVAPGADGTTGSAEERIVVTARDTDRLAPSEHLAEPFVTGSSVRFDAADGPIDFTRVDLVNDDGHTLSAQAVVDEMARAEGVDPAEYHARSFEIAPDEAALTSSDAEPGAEPRAAMRCVYRYCLGYYCWFYDADCP